MTDDVTNLNVPCLPDGYFYHLTEDSFGMWWAEVRKRYESKWWRRKGSSYVVESIVFVPEAELTARANIEWAYGKAHEKWQDRVGRSRAHAELCDLAAQVGTYEKPCT